MKNRTLTQNITFNKFRTKRYLSPIQKNFTQLPILNHKNEENAAIATEILVMTSYPPRECGIATYSKDLIMAINKKFGQTLALKVCALETDLPNYQFPEEVKYVLNTSSEKAYEKLSTEINNDKKINIVLIQHEFGFFQKQEDSFLRFLFELTKPIVIVFHTVLPHPNEKLRQKVKTIASLCHSVIVMTHNSAWILVNDYGLDMEKITVIPHGTHLVSHLSEKELKLKYGLENRKVLTTFGLLSSGKSIETTLDALPAIAKENPMAMLLVIGKTHPEVIKQEGEAYREMLLQKVIDNAIQDHVKFINNYVELPTLLELLQLTDVYVFSTNDPNQAVSGTFVYAMSCACPIISTPIPHAVEILTEDTGIIFDFCDSKKLAEGVNQLFNNDSFRKNMSSNTLQKIISSAWENSAMAHVRLFQKLSPDSYSIQHNLPQINLNHLKLMTTDTGIIQFSKINQPDISSGYTLDDNSRAMIAMGMYLKLSGDKTSIFYIKKYLNFIKYCQQPGGNFLNYVDMNGEFTNQNMETNLEDSNGRAIWALGYTISLSEILPLDIISLAEMILRKSITQVIATNSTRAMAFAIKGLFYFQTALKSERNLEIINILSNRLVQMYKHESDDKWKWFEGYLTYANSIIPEALLYAWLLTGNQIFKETAKASFGFLLSMIFNENGIEVVSNKTWLRKGEIAGPFGEQPIDVAYTVMTLSKFYLAFGDENYKLQMDIAFNWFLGENRLHQIVYNPCTGGCFDGLEETHVNLNQGAESTLSYLMARFTVESIRKGECNIDYGSDNTNIKYLNSNPAVPISV